MWSNVYKCGLPCNTHAVVFAKACLKPAPVHNHTGRRKRCLGSFASEREAAEAYDKAALTLRSNTSPFFQLRIVCLVAGSVQKFAQYLVASQGTQRQLLCLLHALPFLVCLTHMSICSDSNLSAQTSPTCPATCCCCLTFANKVPLRTTSASGNNNHSLLRIASSERPQQLSAHLNEASVFSTLCTHTFKVMSTNTF